jgi:hypothetical protein
MQKSRKNLSADGLWGQIHGYFTSISHKLHEPKNSSASNIVDCLMAACAVFSLKMSSLLQYDKERRNETLFSNVRKLFHIENAPSDTTMRERLDEIAPKSIRGIFKHLFAHLQRGKALENYIFLDGHYLLAGDGTGHFSSNKVHCDNCCETNHKSGEITYQHKMLALALVHPDMKRVLPLCPEPITKQDGASKNDCEQNAAKRMLSDFRREHPHLKVIVTEDSLYSTGPHIRLLNENNIRYIICAKPGNLGSLFDWVSSCEMEIFEHSDEKGNKHKYSFINDVPLNDSNFSTKVNFLEYWETDKKGKTQHFSWITDIEITKKNAEKIMRGGRAKWRIENETFNTLKNQGYNFEHNFGHGYKNLCSIMAMLLMLAFFTDQACELLDDKYQKARAKLGTYKIFWNHWQSLLVTTQA